MPLEPTRIALPTATRIHCLCTLAPALAVVLEHIKRVPLRWYSKEPSRSGFQGRFPVTCLFELESFLMIGLFTVELAQAWSTAKSSAQTTKRAPRHVSTLSSPLSPSQEALTT